MEPSSRLVAMKAVVMLLIWAVRAASSCWHCRLSCRAIAQPSSETWATGTFERFDWARGIVKGGVIFEERVEEHVLCVERLCERGLSSDERIEEKVLCKKLCKKSIDSCQKLEGQDVWNWN